MFFFGQKPAKMPVVMSYQTANKVASEYQQLDKMNPTDLWASFLASCL